MALLFIQRAQANKNQNKRKPVSGVPHCGTKTKNSILCLKSTGEPATSFYDWRWGQDSNLQTSFEVHAFQACALPIRRTPPVNKFYSKFQF